MKRILFGVVLAVFFCSIPAKAQTIGDLNKSLKLMQAEIDRLQTALNADLGEARLGGWLDNFTQNGDRGQFVLVVGWALACGDLEPITQVMIDGVIAETTFVARYQRFDVSGAYSAYCIPYGGLRPDVGATFLVDLSNYGPGQHTIQLRIRDSRGFVVKTNTISVIKP